MNALNHARRMKITQLFLKRILPSLLICAGVLILGSEVRAYWRQMFQATPQTIRIAMSPPTLPPHANISQAMQNTTQSATSAQTIPQLLEAVNKQLDPQSFLYLNTERAAQLRAKLDAPAQNIGQNLRLSMETDYASELVKAGKTEEGLREYSLIEHEMKTSAPAIWQVAGANLLRLEAVAYLRLGEQQNCCANNNAQSCLIPISGAGIHTKQDGSRGAIRCLQEVLQLQPDNTAARWLLNIAYMTIGEYPHKVPTQWLIPLKAYGGEYAMKKFYNAAPGMGLDMLGWAGSVIMEDFEGNGLLDLVVSSFRPDGPLRYFHNNGDGTFTERTQQAGFTGEVGGLNIITTDYNNDGRPDIIVLRGGWLEKAGHYPLSLLRNDGNGHFTDVTIQAGLLTFGPTQTAVAFDYNGDGFLDLFVGYESTLGNSVPCKLFRNNGNGTFTDVTQQCGLNIVRFVKGVVSADFMHTGRPGLYLSCCGEPNILLRNDGPAGPDKSPTAPWKFTDISHQAGVDTQYSSFSCFFFDYDNDGWPDLYVGGYGSITNVGDIANDYLGLPTPAEKARLYHNNHNGTFTDVTKQVHLDKVIEGMGLNYGDLDNDGWLDFYAGTGNLELETLIPNRMFRNHDGKYFDEVTTTGDFGHLQKGHGVAFGDINNNGQQDVFMVVGGAYEGDTAHDCLYVNPGNKNHWVTLKLTGTKSNRIALGAEICVTVATPQGERRIYKTVSTGGSFGNNPLRQEIGLGNATRIKQVSIRWPTSGIPQTITGLSLDRFYKITEGVAKATPWKVPTFKLLTDADPSIKGAAQKTYPFRPPSVP
jgi:hypothetical protein